MRFPRLVMAICAGMILQALPALAACEAEWRTFEIEKERGGASWTTMLQEPMTYDNEVKAIRALVYGNRWSDLPGGAVEKPADPAAAFRKAASVFGGRLPAVRDPDDRAILNVAVCLANAFADEAASQARQQQATLPQPVQSAPAPPGPRTNFQAAWQRECQAQANEFEGAALELNPNARANPAQAQILDDYKAGDFEVSRMTRAQLEAARRTAQLRIGQSDSNRQSRAYGNMVLCGYAIRDRMLREQETAAATPPPQRQALNAPRQSENNQNNAGQDRDTDKDRDADDDGTAQIATQCVKIQTSVPGHENLGAFVNSCDFHISGLFCNAGPRGTAEKGFDCAKARTYGGFSIDGGGHEEASIKNTDMVYFFACKQPAEPVVRFTGGPEIFKGRCQ